MITNLNSILSKGDAGYVDLSNAVEFEPSSSNGCLTIIATSNSTRLQISKSILADLDEPEAVKIHIADKNIAIFSTQKDSHNSLKLGKGGIIYNTELAKKILQISGVDVKEKGSTKLGSYKLQKLDDDTLAAVVSFD